ncbi:MAG TPA: DUF4136 domain-containing protein [Allosphingosinicella sp.]|jgi:hypothetical protein
MKSAFLRGGAILATAALAACSTMGPRTPSGPAPGVEVGRFHLGDPIARAQIAIEPFDRADANRPEFPIYVAAVSRELVRLGWTVVPTTRQSEQIALIDVEQGSREAIAALSTNRVGRGITGAPPPGSAANVTATLLEVGIRRRSDGTVFWEGRAVGEARTGSAEATATVAVGRLASALFRDFPGDSGRIIRLK